MKTFIFYPQLDSMDYGPACLQMTLKHQGRVLPAAVAAFDLAHQPRGGKFQGGR